MPRLRNTMCFFSSLLLLLLLAGCACGVTVVNSITVTVTPGTATVNMAGTQHLAATVSGDSKSQGVTWTLNGAGSLTATSASATVYNAPASVTASTVVTVTAASISDPAQKAVATITILPAPVVTVSPTGVELDSAQVLPMTATVTNDSTNAGVTWTTSVGTIPSASTGGSGGSYTNSFTAPAITTTGTVALIKATSVRDTTAVGQAQIRLWPALKFPTATLPGGTVGQAYSSNAIATAVADGAPYKTFALASGSLPAGISLTADGLLTGTPTATGSSVFSVKVTDNSAVPASVTTSFTLNVSGLAISNTGVPGGVSGVAYSTTTLAATGASGTVTWSIVSGALAPGMSLDPSTGVISGTPASPGTYSPTFKATDATGNSAQKLLAYTIAFVMNVPTPTVADATAGTAITPITLQPTGGRSPYTFTVSSGSTLPAGITLARVPSGTGWVLSGTPTTAGTFTFSLDITDDGSPFGTPDGREQKQTKTISLTMKVIPVTITILTTSLPPMVVGYTYTGNIHATGGVKPYHYAIQAGGDFPAGLTLDANTGLISGKPTGGTKYGFTVEVTDSSATPVSGLKQLFGSIGATALPGGAGQSMMSGTYAFLVEGHETAKTPDGAPYRKTMIGSLTFNSSSGLVTGVVDFHTRTGTATNFAVSGSYSLDATGRGILAMHGTVSTSVQFVFSIAGTAYSRNKVATGMRLMLLDNENGSLQTNMEGFAKQQESCLTTTAAANATFVFGMQGETPAYTYNPNLYGPIVSAGTMKFDGAGAIANGVEDDGAQGTNYQMVPFTGTYTAPTSGSFCRGTYTVTRTAGTYPLAPTDFVYYVINSNDMLVMSTTRHQDNSMVAGEARAQQVGTYTSNNLGLTSTSIAYEGSGQGGDGNALYPTKTAASIFTFDVRSPNNVTVTQDTNSAGTYSSTAGSPQVSGYSVAGNGRMTFGSSTTGPVFWLYNQNSGFGLDQATNGSSPGLIYLFDQSYTAAYSGSLVISQQPAIYVTETRLAAGAGTTTSSAAGSIAVQEDISSAGPTVVRTSSLPGTVGMTVDTATGRIGSPDGKLVGYTISSGKAVYFDKTAGTPQLSVLEQ